MAHRLLVLSLLLLAVLLTNARTIPDTQRVHRTLDPIDSLEKYHVEWEADLETNRITFHIVAETTGFVGFGLSSTGGMGGSDIIISGVFANGSSYLSDRHGVGNQMPVVDANQDWELIAASENSTHTELKFSRLLNTCDNQDVAISSDTVKLIWSYGDSDVISYHGGSRGSYAVNLLDPNMPGFDLEGLDKWTAVANTTMPSESTTYWCSVHRSPLMYNSKRHVVAFDTKLNSPESLKHTHHLSVFKCSAPHGVNATEFFEPYVGQPGGECYTYDPLVVPIEYCRTLIYVWAVGGRAQIFPENVGFPIVENGEPEYLMIEIHYDNPEELEFVQFESAVEIYNTPMLREHEAAVLIVSQEVSYAHLLPPRTEKYVTAGHCGSDCTRDTIRPDGINFFNIMLHAHLTGRQLKLRHFREQNRTFVEQPWVIVDDNYNFDFQQNRPLAEHRKILPGDHLTVECTTDTANRQGVTLGGFSTMEEMCEAIIWYYPRDELKYCQSVYNPEKLMEIFGIEEINWDNMILPPIVTAPESLANKTLNQVLDTMVDWNPEMITEFQQETRFNNHIQSCWNGEMAKQYMKSNRLSKKAEGLPVGYPDLDQVYQPENPCV